MSDVEPKKMKVPELRNELKQRGLDPKGNKNQLVKRLEKAIAEESGTDVANESTQDESILETTTEDIDEVESQPEPTAEAEPEKKPEIKEEAVKDEPEPAAEAQEDSKDEAEDVKAEPEELKDEPEELKDEPEELEDEPKDEPEPEPEPEAEPAKQEVEEEAPVKEDAPADDEKEDAGEEPMEATETKEAAEDAAPAEEAVEAEADEGVPIEGEFQVMDSVGDTEGMEEDEKRGEKRRRSRSRDRDRYGRRSRRSRSRSPRRHRSRSGSRSKQRPRSREREARQDRHHEETKVPEEKDDWLQATNVQLDRYNCDLNLRVREEGTKANPITVEGFAFMWAGARANYGINKGKVAFEVKILEHLNVDHLPPEETHLHVVRVGWSTDKTSLQLGEEKLSYGYGGTSKASVDCKFQDYGQKFAAGDVIGAYLDFESEPMEISYTKNGEDLGKCFDVDKEALEDQAMFPHILSKNTEVEVNFGEKEEPFFPLKEGFTWVNDVPVEDRVRGSLPNAKKEECEIIMMCGLPGSGKTTWATKHATENPDKRFNVLGTNNIIDKMKVMGLPRKKNYAGRWDVLIDKSTRCLNRLMEIAAQKKRNYILDQTNVYPSAQRRKMRPFEGFQRKAVVIVPSDEEFKSRVEKREKEEGKDVPDSAVLEMKANFALPEEGTLFDKVEYVELDKEEAAKVVEKYNKEGRDAAPPPDKRYRDNRYGGRDYNRDNRYNSRGGNRGYQGGGGRGYNSGGGGRGYDRRGSYGGNDRRGSGDRRNNYMGYSQSDRRRYDDRSDRKDYNRSSNYDNRSNRNSGQSWNKSGGGWGNQGSWGGNQGSWGGNQGNWGNNQGNWGQNYQGNWNNQQNQNYNNYNWQNQGNWGGYNQNQGGAWGSGYNNYGSGGGGGYHGHK